MKYFWIFLALFITNKAFSQADTLRLYQAYNSFSNPEKAEWTAFENNWNYIEYSELKKKNKIKGLNCKNCESFYADMYLEINDAGEVTTVVFLKGKICGQTIQNNKLSVDFENSIKSQTFKSLKNRQFIARFGNSLKC
ncbi:MAG: hypothetical protein V4677_06530 [Bacteroidota bacterium]